MAFQIFLQKNLDLLTKKFLFNEKVVNDYKINNAKLYKRLIAFCIDIFLIIVFISLFFSTFIGKEEFKLLEEFIASSKEVGVENVAAILKTLSYITYLSLFLYFFTTNACIGSTIGQKIFNLKLISVRNKYITRYEIFNRTLTSVLVLILSGTLMILLFFLIPLVLTKYKLTLVDMMTSTSIIELKKVS